MAFDWNAAISHPLTQLGANIMAGADPTGEGLGGFGKGLQRSYEGLLQQQQLQQLQAMAERRAEIQQMQLDFERARMERQQREEDRQQAAAELQRQQRETYAAASPEERLAMGAEMFPKMDYERLIQEAATQKPMVVSKGASVYVPGQGFIQSPTAEQPLDAQQRASLANTLRDDFNAEIGGFNFVRDNWQSMQAAGDNPIGDVARVFAYMKLLDPTSTVNKGETATIEQAGGVPSRILALYNNAVLGQGMTDEKRRQLEAEAGKIYNQRLNEYRQSRERYQGLAQQYGIEVGEVTPQRQYQDYVAPKLVGGVVVEEVVEEAR